MYNIRFNTIIPNFPTFYSYIFCKIAATNSNDIFYFYRKPTRCTSFLNLFILNSHSTLFGRSFRPSSGFSRLYIQQQVYIKQILLPAASGNEFPLAAGSSEFPLTGLSNKVSSIIKRHIENMKLLLACTLILSHSFIFNVYMVLFLFNTVIYVFLLLCLIVRLYTNCMFMYLLYVYIFIVCLCIFIVPVGTLRLPWLRVFRAFSSVVRQMPG
jgi:hypothetical protein